MEIKTLFASALLAAAILPASAQELNESMTVQGAYDPVIRHHERLSGLPSRPELAPPGASLTTDSRGVPVSVDPMLSDFSATAYAAELSKPQRGYLDISAGSYLNTSVSAGYRPIVSATQDLRIWLQHTSSSLYRPNELSPYRRRYDETLGTSYFRQFGAGALSAAATYHLGYFNYYRVLTPWGHDQAAMNEDVPGYQTLNDFNLTAAWQSPRTDEGFFYGARATYRYFGFNRVYEWSDFTDHTYASLKPTRENDMRLDLSGGYAFGAAGRLMLDVQGRWLNYANSPLSTAGFYGFTPAYNFAQGPVRLHAGVRLDLTSGVEGYEKFSTFHVAPDVAVSYSASRFTASFEARGGVKPNTLSGLHELAYYSCPTLLATTPAFAPLDLTLRLGFGNFSGLSAELFATYASVHNTPLAGTYPLYLFHQLATPESFILHPAYLNIHGFSLGGSLKYAFGNFVEAEGSLTYSPQNGSRGSFNGVDRPRWVLDTEARVRPISDLTIALGYEYRGVRHLYYRAAPGESLAALRLPDLYNLHARADYTFLRRFTVGVGVDNILSSHAWLTPDMPVEGIVVSGRFSVVF